MCQRRTEAVKAGSQIREPIWTMRRDNEIRRSALEIAKGGLRGVQLDAVLSACGFELRSGTLAPLALLECMSALRSVYHNWPGYYLSDCAEAVGRLPAAAWSVLVRQTRLSQQFSLDPVSSLSPAPRFLTSHQHGPGVVFGSLSSIFACKLVHTD